MLAAVAVLEHADDLQHAVSPRQPHVVRESIEVADLHPVRNVGLHLALLESLTDEMPSTLADTVANVLHACTTSPRLLRVSVACCTVTRSRSLPA